MMKRTVYIFVSLLIFFFTGVSAQEEIHWMSMNEALAAQKKEPKKIIMDAYTVWCGPCKLMAKKTFQNENVVRYINKHYYAVKFNAEGREIINYKGQTYTNPKYDPSRKNSRNYQHSFARHLGIRGYPTVVFFDEEANLITPLMGYRTPQQLELFLKMIARNDYKKLDTKEAWKTYRSNFKHTFQN